LQKYYGILSSFFLPIYPHVLGIHTVHCGAYILRLDGQLPVESPVDEHQQFD
jgi:hypothetical protein